MAATLQDDQIRPLLLSFREMLVSVDRVLADLEEHARIAEQPELRLLAGGGNLEGKEA